MLKQEMSLVFEHEPLPDRISRQLEGEIASRETIAIETNASVSTV